MKSLVFILFISFLLTGTIFGQPAQLVVKSNEKGLYLEHTVVAKEGFFSVGRLYNVHPKFLAAYNNLDINKGLNIGQLIQIPLTDTNFSQRFPKGVPVFYTVGEKEGLMKVSNANNKVKLQSIREWNKLTSDNLKAGSKLIVGYLVLPEGQPVVVATPKEETKKPAEEEPVAKTETATPAVKTETAGNPVTNTATPAANPTVPETKTVTPTREEPKTTTQPAEKQEPENNLPAQGYFGTFFEQQAKQHPPSKNETVTSGFFKTNYGQREAKYYMLMDKVTPGTIVRIINPENNKMVYAKVLGEMSGIRQNKGLDIRISDSAASALGIADMEKFIVKINY